MTNNQGKTDNVTNENTMSNNNEATEQVHYSIGKIIFAIILLFFFIIGLVDKISDISHYEKDYSQEAYTAAKFYVNKQLKAPATADYPMYDKNFITHHNDSYTVSSYVDAENSFGVKGRLYYTVTMERDGKDWINVNVNLSE
jgi:hypothetical protein|nr:MAG TPA: hypothetical protein [Caudoviricetes sp.]